jgi:hypothetical protein
MHDRELHQFDPPVQPAPRQPYRPNASAYLERLQACQYREIMNGFRASGGVISADEAVTLLMRRTDQPISRLARWIVDREVISLEWQARTVLPRFQFDLPTMTPRTSVSTVFRELIPALTDWEICLWLVTPNAWLANTSPLDAIASDPAAVVDAARGERYLLRC